MLTNTPKTLPITKKAWQNDYRKYLDDDYEKKHALLQTRFKFTPITETTHNRPKFIGFDTETYERNGNMLCLCTSEDRYKYITGYEDREPLFEHIFNYFAIQPKGLFVAYNLKFDAEVILKSLGKEILTKFYREDKFEGNYDGYKIKYIPKKFLSIKKGKTNLMFFDALQFFIGSGVDGKTDLDSVAKLWLG